MHLNVSHAFLPKQNSTRAAQVMDHFGIGFEQGRCIIAEKLEIPIDAGDVVLFNGASGSGKSSLMRAVSTNLRAASTVLDINELDLGERILIESLPVETSQAMHLLSACGLGEAQLMLRTPAELSDGQRYRFRLALGLAMHPQWITADEFTATLDRTLARVIAFNIRRLADRTGIGFLLATTHDDVAEDLEADVRVLCRLDGVITVERREKVASVALTPGPSPGVGPPEVGSGSAGRGEGARKKKRCRSGTNCGSARRPSATGRTSLGGITAATSSG